MMGLYFLVVVIKDSSIHTNEATRDIGSYTEFAKFQTASLCLFTISPCMYRFWQWKSPWGHVSGLVELYIEQEMEGKRACSKNFCLQALPMYCPVQNLMRQVICDSVMVGFFQQSVESFRIYVCV